MKIRFIGDVHGKFSYYRKIIRDVPCSMQVGDMGVGFFRYDYHLEEKVPLANPPFDAMENGDHTYIRGNHDNLEVCKRQKHWVPDGTMKNGVFCVGGAWSIDQAWRTEGLSWWADEQLSYSEMSEILEKYINEKPNVVMTHDCPFFLYPHLIMGTIQGDKKTPMFHQSMFENHKPKIWLFGHHHKSFRMNVMGTEFVCLNELEYLDLEMDNIN